MVLIFDLDDTLYDELSYVVSGLHAVAKFGESAFGWEAGQSFDFMHAHLLKHGRGQVFDEWLRTNGRHSVSRVAECVKVYRHHKPNISLFPFTLRVLDYYKTKGSIYLVTDGHKVVQNNKIKALNLETFFKKAFITHRFGIRHAKPSLHCFEIIRSLERCKWSEIVYVGDNPTKDFVNLNQVGAITVRVNTGFHSSVVALPGHDARMTIPDLGTLPKALGNWRSAKDDARSFRS